MDELAGFLDDWLSFRVEQSDIPGLSVVVRQEQEVIYHQVFGAQSTYGYEYLDTGHVFNIGSQAKMMTAVLVLQLAREGRLSLRDVAAKYLPWLRRHADRRFCNITIGQLLWHGSGMMREGGNADYWQLLRPFPSAAQLEEIVLGSRLILDSGYKLKYSNLGYSLLGQIIEAVSGQTYADCSKIRIIDALGLVNTYVDCPQIITDRIICGYLRRGRFGRRTSVPKAVEVNTFAPVCGWYTDALEMGTVITSMCSDDDSRLLGTDEKALMRQGLLKYWRPYQDRDSEYGLGIMKIQHEGRVLYGHSGAFIGHSSCSFFDIQTKHSVVVMSNAKDTPVNEVALGIMKVLAYFEEYGKSPTPIQIKHLNTRLGNTLGVKRLVALNGKIACVFLDDWAPFDCAEDLQYVNHSTLKIAKAFDLQSPGEEIRLQLQGNDLKAVNYAGVTMWPL